MELFISQFEIDSDNEDEQYAQQDYYETVDNHISHTPTLYQSELDDDEEDIDDSNQPTKTKEEDMHDISTSILDSVDDKRNDPVVDIFANRYSKPDNTIIDEVEEIEPITGKNMRLYDLKNEVDYGDAIWKALYNANEGKHTKKKSDIVKKIEEEDSESDDFENENKMEKNHNDLDDESKENGTNSTNNETNPFKRHRFNLRNNLVSVDRLLHNHSNHVLIHHQTHNEKGRFHYWPPLHPSNLDVTDEFHWSKHCRIIMKLAARLIILNGTDYPQALQLLSLIYKTPTNLAPRLRLGYQMIEQSLYGFKARGRSKNINDTAKILNLENPDEKQQNYSIAGRRVWEKILVMEENLRENKLKKNKKKSKKRKLKNGSCKPSTPNSDKMRNNEDLDNISESNSNSFENHKIKVSEDKYEDESNFQNKDILFEGKQESLFPNEDNNAFYEVDFAADISDDEPQMRINIPTSRKITMLNNIRRHAFLRGVVHSSTLDLNTVKLTLSVLLSKLGEERVVASNINNMSKISTRHVRAINDEINDYLSICFQELDKLPFHIVSSVKATAAQMHLSYSCNIGYGSRSESFTIIDEGNEVSTIALADGLQQSSSKFREILKLRTFPAIQSTLGISIIAANIGKTGATILAQDLSWCDNERRTPFDLMKKALEYLENNGKLKRGHEFDYYDEDATNVHMDIDTNDERLEAVDLAKLVDSLEQASDIFSSCLNSEPDNIIYHSWYLASLGAILVLSSGMIIGKKKKESLSQYQVHGSRMNESIFVKYRKFAVGAFKEIQSIIMKVSDKNNDGIGPLSRYHMAIASFLEWSDATCLMIDGFVKNASALKDMRRTHAWHTVQWAFEEKTAVAMKRLEDLHSYGEVSSQVLIAMQASVLESNMGNRQVWLDMVSYLGSIGRSIDKRGDSTGLRVEDELLGNFCDGPTCKQCRFLVNGAQFDHEEFEGRETKGWWGESRSWWKSYFFGPLPSHNRFIGSNQCMLHDKLKDEIKYLYESLMMDFSKINLNFDGARNNNGIGLKNMNEENADNHWMYDNDEEDDNDDEDDYDIKKEEDHAMDDVLKNFNKDSTDESDNEEPSHFTDGIFPQNINENINLRKKNEKRRLAPNLSNTAKGKFFEMLAFKIVVASHLLGIEDSYISTSICWIAETCCSMATKKTDKESYRSQDSYQSLIWLVSMGLNVMRILEDHYI